jgi:hypothetical protein
MTAEIATAAKPAAAQEPGVTRILSTPLQEFARHRLANLPVVNAQELRNGFNSIRYSSMSRLDPAFILA